MAGSLLVVCDRPDVAELEGRTFRARGFGVEMIDNVDTAVTLLGMQSPPFDGVVIDLEAGTTEALRALDRIRGLDDVNLAATPVIICAWKEENRLFSWQSGADGFVVRPYHVEELLDLVAGALARDEDERLRFRNEQMQLASGG